MTKGNNIRLGQELRRLANIGETKTREEIIDYLFDKRDKFATHIQNSLVSLKYLSILNDTVEVTVTLTSDVAARLSELNVPEDEIQNVSFMETKKAWAQRFSTAMNNFVTIINEVTMSPAFKENNEPYGLKSQRHGDYIFVTEDEFFKSILKNQWVRLVRGASKLGALNPEDNAMNEVLRILTRYGKTYKLK
jgi:hypothetical protein